MTTSHFSSTVATSSPFPSFFPLSLPSAKRIIRVNVRPSKKSSCFNRTIHSREGRDIRDIGSRGNIFPRCYRKNGDETIGASGPRKRSRGWLVKHRWIPLHLAGFRLDPPCSNIVRYFFQSIASFNSFEEWVWNFFLLIICEIFLIV